MKTTGIMLIAVGFAAGLGVGLFSPMARAGSGLAGLMSSDGSLTAKLVRVTVSPETSKDDFQPADFRWNAGSSFAKAAICAPKDDAAHAVLPTIQHL